MKPYAEYKNSNIEWLGEIPKHWEVTRIKCVEKNEEYVVQTGPFGAQLHASDYVDNGIPLVLIRNVNNLKIYDDDIPMISAEDAERLYIYRLNLNDIVFSRVGSIGRIALVSSKEVGWLISGQMLRLRIKNPLLNHQYLVYLISSSNLNHYFSLQSVGCTRESINTDILRNMILILPSLKEQQIVANFLDNKTTKIDKLIETKQKQIELLKEQRIAVINQAVTKGLDPDAVMKDSVVEWLDEIPKHWDLIKIKYLFTLMTEQAPPNNDYELLSLYTDIGVKPRKELEARGNRASTTDGYWIVKKGDIIVNKLLAWMGAVGHSDYDGVTSPAYDILRKKTDLNSKFYHYLFRCGLYLTEFKRRSRGIMEMRLRLYFDELGQIFVVYPPPSEQDAIVRHIDEINAETELAISKAEKQIELLTEYRTALISEAVTGKIDVREWAN